MIKIAEGSYSEVFITPNQNVIKKYKTTNAYVRELNIMRLCKNTSHILQPLDIQENQITLPLMSPIDNLNFTDLQSKDRLSIIQSMIAGLKELHKLNIIHHDLKPENILYDPKTLSIKLSDFSSSFTVSEYFALDEHNKALVDCSTSPLHTFYRKIVSKSDLFTSDQWALAITILQLYKVNCKQPLKLPKLINRLKHKYPEDHKIFWWLIKHIKFEY